MQGVCVLVFWCFGVLVFWCWGWCWCFGVLVFWCFIYFLSLISFSISLTKTTIYSSVTGEIRVFPLIWPTVSPRAPSKGNKLLPKSDLERTGFFFFFFFFSFLFSLFFFLFSFFSFLFSLFFSNHQIITGGEMAKNKIKTTNNLEAFFQIITIIIMWGGFFLVSSPSLFLLQLPPPPPPPPLFFTMLIGGLSFI